MFNQAIRPALWIKIDGIETGSGISDVSDADSGELTIDDFLGSYMDMDPDNIIPGFSNPSLLDLYYDEINLDSVHMKDRIISY